MTRGPIGGCRPGWSTLHPGRVALSVTDHPVETATGTVAVGGLALVREDDPAVIDAVAAGELDLIDAADGLGRHYAPCPGSPEAERRPVP